MSEAVELALVNKIPEILFAISSFASVLVGYLTHKSVAEVKSGIGEVKHELNSTLTARVQSAEDTGGMKERERAREYAAAKEEGKP